ncbi:MAG: glycosyltransferase family 2 protein [Bifidobacterium animalis]|nr:glycosyltransferase family 2 protein [Bifidobacterium animalis]
MPNSNLVSIISPCYNGEGYVGTFLDSVLQQDYSNVEVILVDDGSSDNTQDKVLSYLERFKQRGYSLRYLHQENGGQASAINAGLEEVHGEFLMWMDSDDILMPNALSKKVEFLQNNPRIGFVICQGYVVRDVDPTHVISIQKRNHKKGIDHLFKDLLDESNVVFTPAAYMARNSALLRAIPSRRIFESREGQNWQLLLPLAYTTQYGYIDEPLYKYVIRPQSHSHEYRSYENQLQRFNGFEELQSQTILRIPGMSRSEKQQWRRYIHTNINRRKMRLALEQFHLKDWLHWYMFESDCRTLFKYNPLPYYSSKIIRYIKNKFNTSSYLKHIMKL